LKIIQKTELDYEGLKTGLQRWQVSECTRFLNKEC